MQPRGMPRGDRRDLRHGVDGARGRRAHRRGDEERSPSCGGVGIHRGGERVDVHPPGGIEGNLSQPVSADADNPGRLLHARMGIDTRVGHERPLVLREARVVGDERCCPLAGGDQGHEHAARRGILEHAAACAAAREPLGQAEQAAEPVEHVRLQFRARGRRGPEHALHADSGREQLAEDRRPAGAGREVAEEGGMLPVQEPRRDDPVKVSEHIGERLGRFRRLRRQVRPHITRRQGRRDRPRWKRRPVVRDPVDDRAALLAESLGIERGLLFRHEWHSMVCRLPTCTYGCGHATQVFRLR